MPNGQEDEALAQWRNRSRRNEFQRCTESLSNTSIAKWRKEVNVIKIEK
jgi:hypothetical protein